MNKKVVAFVLLVCCFLGLTGFSWYFADSEDLSEGWDEWNGVSMGVFMDLAVKLLEDEEFDFPVMLTLRLTLEPIGVNGDDKQPLDVVLCQKIVD